MHKLERTFSIVFTILGAFFLILLSLILNRGWYNELKVFVLVFSILGVCFFTAGVLVIINYLWKTNRTKKLKNEGLKIIIAPQDVTTKKVNYSDSIAYVVIGKWNKNKTDFYEFTSKEISYNPKEFLKDKDIVIYVNKENPEKYLVDISFLPELAN